MMTPDLNEDSNNSNSNSSSNNQAVVTNTSNHRMTRHTHNSNSNETACSSKSTENSNALKRKTIDAEEPITASFSSSPVETLSSKHLNQVSSTRNVKGNIKESNSQIKRPVQTRQQ